MNCEVVNAGSPGRNTRAILSSLDSEVLSRKPELTVLLAGTNDSLNSAALLPLADSSANLSEIVAKLRGSGSKILMLTPPPFHKPYLLARHPAEAYGSEGPETRLNKFVAMQRRLCGALSIPLVDLNRIFAALGEIGEGPTSLLRNKANSNSEDGIHPTADGYRLVAACVYQAILDLNLPRGRIVCAGDSMTYGLNMAGMGSCVGESYPARLQALLNGGLAN